MSEWSEKPLEHLADFVMGQSPDSSTVSELPGGLPFLQGCAEFGHRNPEPKFYVNPPLRIAPKGSTLVSVRAPVGTMNRADQRYGIGRGLAAVVARGCSDRFLRYAIELGTPWLHRRSQGSTFLAVGSEDMRQLPINISDNPDERETAANIIALIDTQIEATEALIAKQERVRAGLMQDLFTRGVDEDGQLRPPRQETPHLYRPTELGWLPNGWKAPELESLLADIPTPMRSGPFGSALLKHELASAGIPFLGIDNVHVEQFKPDFIRFVTPQKFAELYRYRVLPDDVVITIMGTVGRCCVIPHGYGEMLSSKHLWTMTFDQTKVLPELVCWQLNHAPWVLSWFRAKSQGGIMDAIQSSTLRELRLPLPRPPEQSHILRIYREATSHLQAMRDEVSKLALRKSGLMQDLLTGKVSVAPLLESIAA